MHKSCSFNFLRSPSQTNKINKPEIFLKDNCEKKLGEYSLRFQVNRVLHLNLL